MVHLQNDGASNVQKAGELMTKQYSHCTVIQGIELTVALVFGKFSPYLHLKSILAFQKGVLYHISHPSDH